MDTYLNEFYSHVEGICQPLFKKNVFHDKSDNRSGSNCKESQPWYDSECKIAQSDFYECLHYFRSNISDENREHMVTSRSKYKAMIRSKKYNHEQLQISKLETLRAKNAR